MVTSNHCTDTLVINLMIEIDERELATQKILVYSYDKSFTATN